MGKRLNNLKRSGDAKLAYLVSFKSGQMLFVEVDAAGIRFEKAGDQVE